MLTKEQYEEKIRQLEREKRELKKEYEEKLKRYIVKNMLKEAGGRNEKALLALIDMSGITLREDEMMVEGLDIKQLKKEVPYLFEEEERIEGTGYYGTNRRMDSKSEVARQFQAALMRR